MDGWISPLSGARNTMHEGFTNQLIEMLGFGFVQRALIAGIFISVCCAFLGNFLVLRRLSMIGDGLGHLAFGMIGFAFLINVYPFYVAAPLVILFSLAIMNLTEKADVYGDAAIGLISALGVAIGVIFASIGGGFNVDLFSYLFGDILTVSLAETIMAVVLSGFVITIVCLYYHELFAITFDEEYSKTLGIRTARINRVLIILTSLTVVLGIKVVGTMLVSSLIIFPCVTALQLARSFKFAIALAAILASASVVSGVFISFLFNLPAGATIVMVNFVFFIAAFMVKKLRKT